MTFWVDVGEKQSIAIIVFSKGTIVFALVLHFV